MRRLLLIISSVAVLSSCATLKRAFTKDTSDPCAPPSQITKEYSPDGIVEELWFDCSVEGPTRRRMLVYLPADYYRTKERYPVLYLLHGARGNETSWIKDGRLIYLTDSLRRNNLCEKYIVVLPNMNQYNDDADFANSRFKKPFESFYETDGAVETAFVRDVVGNVDTKYRTIPDKHHRAIAGLSVGALQTIYITAANPDIFDYVAIFSPFYKAPIVAGDYSNFYSDLDKKLTAQFAEPPVLYAIYIGYWDFFIMHQDSLRAILKKNNCKFEYVQTSGGHDWPNWKEYYLMFSQRIFR